MWSNKLRKDKYNSIDWEENIKPDVLVEKITGYYMGRDVWEEQNIK